MLLNRTVRRPVRVGVAAVFLIFAFVFLTRPRNHVLQADVLQRLPSLSGLHPNPNEVAPLCRSHGFSPYRNHGQRRKVYDLFLFSYELEWLEIRLNTLAPYVDYFVVVEATNTFTALPKPLILPNHWNNFTAFHLEMLYFTVEDTIRSTWTWDHEDFIRNALLYETFPRMREDQQASYGDVLVVSDIDEIPKPETMLVLRYCDIPARVTLRSNFYCYSFQWLHRGEQWAHPQATVYRGLNDTVSPTHLRNGDEGPGWLYLRPLMRWWEKADIWNAAWHCSSCFSSINAIQTKMSSFSHTPWNSEVNRDPQTIVARVRNGTDLFGREDMFYNRVDGNTDVPKYVLEHEDRFGHLLDRDGEDAAFTDYVPPA